MEYQANQKLVTISEGEKKLYVLPYSSSIIRFSDSLISETPAVTMEPTPVAFTVQEDPEGLLISFESFSLLVLPDLKVRFSNKTGTLLEEIPYAFVSSEPTDHLAEKEGHQFLNGEHYSFFRAFNLSNEAFYGLGDHPGPLNRRGYQFVNWNTDDPHAHTENFPSLYKSSPFLLVHKPTASFGLFLNNPYKTLFNCGTDEKEWFIGATNGPTDFYLIYGPTPRDVVTGFSNLVGKFPLPARWTLGYGQSRWSYASEEAVRAVVKGYEEAKIPLSSIYLDIDYMDGYRVFTVSPKNFPHLKELVDELHKKGIKVVTILDPGVKVDPNYAVYTDGLRRGVYATLKGETYVNEVWPGDSVYPTFNEEKTRQWWGDLCKTLLDYGIDGLWCDMNEPASFKGPLPNDVVFGLEKHEKIHNLYGHYMAEATYDGILEATEKRPFVITRACFSGTNRYSTVWTGDNQSLYSHLRMAIPQQLSMGLSLMPFVGTDIGGFSGNCPSELMARWIELGSFSPLFRNHSDCACHPQEGYRYPKNIQDIYRKWVNFRYALTPYFYDLFYEETLDGLPALRPLFLDYDEERFLNENTEFMVGDFMLVAPVLEPGAQERTLLLPSCRWYSFDLKENLGPGMYAKSCPLGEALVYVKEGSIIPLYPEGFTRLDENPEELTLRLFPGKGKYIHYQDEGDGFGYKNGEYNLYEFTNDDGKFSFRLLHEGYKKYRSIRVISAFGETKILL